MNLPYDHIASNTTNEIGLDYVHNKNSDSMAGKPNILLQDLSSREASEGIKTVPKRWFILLIYSLCSMINQVAWISLQPVSDKISKAYG